MSERNPCPAANVAEATELNTHKPNESTELKNAKVSTDVRYTAFLFHIYRDTIDLMTSREVARKFQQRLSRQFDTEDHYCSHGKSENAQSC